jgi:2,3-oxidosqualene cyclase
MHRDEHVEPMDGLPPDFPAARGRRQGAREAGREPASGALPRPASSPAPGDDALGRAIDHLLSLQSARGDWEGEMVWNTMILSQLVIVRAVCGRPFDEKERRGMIRHFEVSQTADGAWGMHPESGGFVFFTALGYVALRLLGVGPDEPIAQRARSWLHAQPGAVLSIPTWGKYWLSFIGLYEYEGTNPCPPEMYALPSWLPIHPSKWYCHTRNIYMALSWLYGSRFRADLGPITAALRDELYGAPYDSIDFAAHRHDVAKSDLHVAPSLGVRASAEAMRMYERAPSRPLRRRALEHCFEQIVYEQRATRYQGLSPVNGLLNTLALHARDPGDPDVARSLAGVTAWKWEDEAEGIRYCGARSNTWDTAFAMQALLGALARRSLPAAERARCREALGRGYAFLRGAQLTTELLGHHTAHRDPALGGFCFSDGVHRWPVSDCTAEALSAILGLHAAGDLAPPPPERIPGARIALAARFILSRQNDDGGFGTYERRRGGPLLEGINNTEMYGNCMTERSYVECTASSVTALAHLREAPPAELTKRDRAQIDRAIDRGVARIRGAQRPDGGYLGFWGVNFTSAIWHVVKALRAAGALSSDPTLARAAAWLASHQRADGGWGEHYSGCLEDRYVEHPESQPVMTAWAVLALVEVLGPHARAVERGLAWLSERQRADGSWAQGAVNGVFFGSAMLDYRYYKAYFPAWALALGTT